MAVVETRELTKVFQQGAARRGRQCRSGEPGGRVSRPPRPFGLRQDDAPAHDRGPRGADVRRDPASAAESSSTTSLRAQRRIAMVFQSYALYPAPDRLREHRLSAEGAGRSRRSERRTKAEWAAGLLGISAAPRPQAARALGRRAAARGAGARDRSRALALPLDEPLSNLDAKFARRHAEELKRLHREHRVPRRCTSRTTRSRRWRWATESWS